MTGLNGLNSLDGLQQLTTVGVRITIFAYGGATFGPYNVGVDVSALANLRTCPSVTIRNASRVHAFFIVICSRKDLLP